MVQEETKLVKKNGFTMTMALSILILAAGFVWESADAFFLSPADVQARSSVLHGRIAVSPLSRFQLRYGLTRARVSSLSLSARTDADKRTDRLEESLMLVNVTSKVNILSLDPLVYEIPEFLSEIECQAYREYVSGDDSGRPLTRSNPPDVSLNISKLWPLPFLALLAGVPPYIRLLQQSGADALSFATVARAVVRNVLIALSAMACLAWWVVVPLVRRQSNETSRTSVAAALNQEQDIDFVRPLVERVNAATYGHPWQCWEAPVVTKYEKGAVFARHADASPTQGSEWMNLGGQRVVTCICYLNTVTNGGGETYFDKLGLTVKPEAGKALVFFPADSETWRADARTTHESLPPSSEKWIVQMFGRAERVPPPLGLPDSFAS